MPMRRRLDYKPGKIRERFEFNGTINYWNALRIMDLQHPTSKLQIKERYKKLVCYYHPDKQTGSTNIMQAINVAADYLSQVVR